jgi:hypothetical protein
VIIDKQTLSLGFGQVASGSLQDIGMGFGMTHIPSDISLDYAQCDFHRSLLLFI